MNKYLQLPQMSRFCIIYSTCYKVLDKSVLHKLFALSFETPSYIHITFWERRLFANWLKALLWYIFCHEIAAFTGMNSTLTLSPLSTKYSTLHFFTLLLNLLTENTKQTWTPTQNFDDHTKAPLELYLNTCFDSQNVSSVF